MRVSMPQRSIRQVLVNTMLAVGLAVSLTVSPGCSTNPATGERQLNAISESREIEIGKDAEPKFLKQYGGELPDNEVVRYVRALGNKLAAESERPDLPWKFHVVDSASVNAFALPGGKIFLSRGLLARMKNEAQVAGVLGHEIGHVTAQHIGQQMTRSAIAQGVIAGIGIAGQASEEEWVQVLGVGAQIGGGLYLLKFSRDQESQADVLGLRYMTRLNYNPIGQLQVMKILQREANQRGSAQLEILSTHPLPQTRIDDIESLIQEKYPDYDDPRKYKLARDRFQNKVASRLEQLPPPEHDPAKNQQSQ